MNETTEEELHDNGDATSQDKLQLDLYENGIDSIRHAIEHYTSQDTDVRRFKYALLHLSQGVLLILKERLRREHPNFIFQNVADPNKTVDVETTLARLEKIAGVSLGNSTATIKELLKLRNTIEHFAITFSQGEADRIIGQAIPFIVQFVQDELDGDLAALVGEPWWGTYMSIEENFRRMVVSAEASIRSEGKRPFFCARCGADTATIVPIPPDESWRVYELVVCRVCRDEICSLTVCRECGNEARTEPFLWGPEDARRIDKANIQRYCSSCRDRFVARYSGFRAPLFIAEIVRWFETNRAITVGQLESLLGIVVRAGPSGRPQYVTEVVHLGVLVIEDDETRKVYEARGGYAPYHGLMDSTILVKGVFPDA